MTDNQINTAIAQACGWDGHCPRCAQGIIEHHDMDGNYVGSSQCECGGQPLAMPDYCNDLNAMHDTLMILTDSEEVSFDADLEMICAMNNPNGFIWQASAKQFAEAFLKAKGLWHDP